MQEAAVNKQRGCQIARMITSPPGRTAEKKTMSTTLSLKKRRRKKRNIPVLVARNPESKASFLMRRVSVALC